MRQRAEDSMGDHMHEEMEEEIALLREREGRSLQKILDLRRQLRAWMSRFELRTRWPCPTCHRAAKDAPLQGIEVKCEDGSRYYGGCTTCTNDDLIEATREELDLA